jgi:hypothetical protein
MYRHAVIGYTTVTHRLFMLGLSLILEYLDIEIRKNALIKNIILGWSLAFVLIVDILIVEYLLMK